MSNNSLKEFKIAHQSILETIDGIRVNIRDYLRIKSKLKDLEAKLLLHFGKQDIAFFARLQEFYASASSTIKIISFLGDDLKDIKVKTLVFFDRYPAEIGDIGKPMFPLDFMEFSKTVISRIEIEENFLLPLLKKMAV